MDETGNLRKHATAAPVQRVVMLRWRERVFVSQQKSERRDNEVGAPENRIEWLKPHPDAPA